MKAIGMVVAVVAASICSSACGFSRQAHREAAADPTDVTDLSIAKKLDDPPDPGSAGDGDGRGRGESSPEEIKNLQEFITRIENYLALNPDWKNEAWAARAAARSDLGDAAPIDAIRAYNRGVKASAVGRFTEAVKHYEEAVLLDPVFPWPANNLAWVLATCPDEKLRDGRRAIEYARRAIQVPKVEVPDFINTLAAAYAAAGDFDAAVRLCRKSLEMWPREEFKEMLRCFLAGSAYTRKGPPPEKSEFLSAEGFGEAKWGMTKLDVLEVFPESAIQNNDVVFARRENGRGSRTAMALHFRFDMLYRVQVAAVGVQEADIETDFIKAASNGKETMKKIGAAEDGDWAVAVWESDETRIEVFYTRSKSEVEIEFVSKRFEELAPPQPAKRQNS
jgi:tetratricopeptide (TPR) repeat protein